MYEVHTEVNAINRVIQIQTNTVILKILNRRYKNSFSGSSIYLLLLHTSQPHLKKVRYTRKVHADESNSKLPTISITWENFNIALRVFIIIIIGNIKVNRFNATMIHWTIILAPQLRLFHFSRDTVKKIIVLDVHLYLESVLKLS